MKIFEVITEVTYEHSLEVVKRAECVSAESFEQVTQYYINYCKEVGNQELLSVRYILDVVNHL